MSISANTSRCRERGIEATQTILVPTMQTPISRKETVSFQSAINIVIQTAKYQAATTLDIFETVPLLSSLGRIAAEDVIAPRSTPPADTSAMDGYAVCSSKTKTATPSTPIVFCVKGSMLAGQRTTLRTSLNADNGIWPCVEIATGARFPIVSEDEAELATFDAVLPYEHTTTTAGPDPEARYIEIVRPAKPHQHRRSAGCDIVKESVVIRRGFILHPQQIMALASLGIWHIRVCRKLKIGVWSTGNELQGSSLSQPQPASICVDDPYSINDANGPFLMSALERLGYKADFLGVLSDDGIEFERRLGASVIQGQYDVYLTTGAVSMGRNDFIRPVLENLSSHIIFHGAQIRPGHPILFASLLRSSNKDAETAQSVPAFFGLPGNPSAAAVGFRFFVVPYLRTLQGLPEEKPRKVLVQLPERDASECDRLSEEPRKIAAPSHLDSFWHGTLIQEGDTSRFCVSKDQSPAKVNPLSRADSWIHIPAGHGDVYEGEQMDCYPLLPSNLDSGLCFAI